MKVTVYSILLLKKLSFTEIKHPSIKSWKLPVIFIVGFLLGSLIFYAD